MTMKPTSFRVELAPEGTECTRYVTVKQARTYGGAMRECGERAVYLIGHNGYSDTKAFCADHGQLKIERLRIELLEEEDKAS